MNRESSVAELVRTSMLDADLNVRYFARLASDYQKWDRTAKILIAVTSSAAVSGWAIWGQPGLDWIWQAASGVAALVAIALPIADPTSALKTASKLSGSWSALLREYEFLWARVDGLDEAAVQGEYRGISSKEDPLNEIDVSMPRRQKLLERCMRDVCIARGLPTV